MAKTKKEKKLDKEMKAYVKILCNEEESQTDEQILKDDSYIPTYDEARELAPMPDKCPLCGEGLTINDGRGGYCTPCRLWTVGDLVQRLAKKIIIMQKAHQSERTKIEKELKMKDIFKSIEEFFIEEFGWSIELEQKYQKLKQKFEKEKEKL